MLDGNWQNDNQLCVTLDGLQLMVRRFDHCARFIIWERPHDSGASPGLLLASGTADDLDAAIAAARRTAGRVHAVLAERRRPRG